ncbi:FAD binding domain-containing protein [Epithele typhae]|uniref:FAD binding domain-containing protein n=1 Tax=Epithele typhae TaxID=378194 RepID=UPI002007660C|nr:FAD binding domain-containing protein [Epithele typhae]KAH9944956.1 FAD binding domain-containing protein [Epithele typhae]
MPKESEVDVLIIGAGPAGVMCANALSLAGVNMRIVDKRPAKIAAGQADGIQPRTIEVFQSYGLGERLIREGNQMHMAAFYNPSPSGGIEVQANEPFHNSNQLTLSLQITLHQGAIEAIFLDSMRTRGVEVERPIVPTAIEISESEAELKDPTSHPIKVTLQHLDPAAGEDPTEIVRAKFVLGADGAHSWVRKEIGITLDGEQTDYVWGVVDMIPDTDFPDIRCKCAVHSDNGSCMIIPREGDKIRLYIQLSDRDVIDPATGRVDKNRFGPDKILQVAKKSFHPFEISQIGEIDWWTLYLIGQRVATRFSVHERVFIAGDACHTHSPKAGQGMNASMNDTHNLAWKLAHVLRGWADISLLKTYEFERRKYAQDLIDFDKKFSKLFSGKPRTKLNQDGVSHEEFIEAFQTFGLFTSGIGVHYEPSVLSSPAHQPCASNLTVGQRLLPYIFVRAADGRPYEIHDLLPSDTRFKILVFVGNTVAPTQPARVQALADQMAAPESFLQKFGKGKPEAIFDVWSISSAKKTELNYTDLPRLFRPHWSKVLLDDVDMYGRSGSGGYKKYGIDEEKGAIVVIRPDGYVGVVAPFEGLADVETYFSGFMIA